MHGLLISDHPFHHVEEVLKFFVGIPLRFPVEFRVRVLVPYDAVPFHAANSVGDQLVLDAALWRALNYHAADGKVYLFVLWQPIAYDGVSVLLFAIDAGATLGPTPCGAHSRALAQR